MGEATGIGAERRWGMYLFSSFFKIETFILVHLKIQDCFTQNCEQIKNIFLGYNNTLLINFKKLIRLKGYPCVSAEYFLGPLTWAASGNPQMNQLIVDGLVYS